MTNYRIFQDVCERLFEELVKELLKDRFTVVSALGELSLRFLVFGATLRNTRESQTALPEDDSEQKIARFTRTF